MYTLDAHKKYFWTYAQPFFLYSSYKRNLVLNFKILGINIKDFMHFKLENILKMFAVFTKFDKIPNSNAHKESFWIYSQLYF